MAMAPTLMTAHRAGRLASVSDPRERLARAAPSTHSPKIVSLPGGGALYDIVSSVVEQLLEIRPWVPVDDGPGRAGSPEVKMLVGSFDGVVGRFVTGWAWDESVPDQTQVVELRADGRLFGIAPADRFSAQLLARRIGNGRHAFEYLLPAELCDGREHIIEVAVVGAMSELDGARQWFSGRLGESLDRVSARGSRIQERPRLDYPSDPWRFPLSDGPRPWTGCAAAAWQGRATAMAQFEIAGD
jgi:hypothetical protein